MKNTYFIPEMKISRFNAENVVTTSALTANAADAVTSVEGIDTGNIAQVSYETFSFTF
ncbi:MAG: hypothetical protein ACI4EA_10645 [Candidatus Ornithomonoglobus sp.]